MREESSSLSAKWSKAEPHVTHSSSCSSIYMLSGNEECFFPFHKHQRSRACDRTPQTVTMRHLVSVAIAAALGAAGMVAMGGAAYYYLRKKIRGSVRSHRPDEVPEQQERHLKLYHSFPFRSSRCAWLVKELHVEDYVEVVSVNIHGSEAKELLEYRDIHPHGTLPALLLEDGKVILESSAICLYLAEAFLNSDGENLLPEPEYLPDYFK